MIRELEKHFSIKQVWKRNSWKFCENVSYCLGFQRKKELTILCWICYNMMIYFQQVVMFLAHFGMQGVAWLLLPLCGQQKSLCKFELIFICLQIWWTWKWWRTSLNLSFSFLRLPSNQMHFYQAWVLLVNSLSSLYWFVPWLFNMPKGWKQNS